MLIRSMQGVEHLKAKELWKKLKVILLSDEALGVDRAVAGWKVFSLQLRLEGNARGKHLHVAAFCQSSIIHLTTQKF